MGSLDLLPRLLQNGLTREIIENQNGTGSRSPRRDGDEEQTVHNNIHSHQASADGIPQLPDDITFDSR